MRYYLLILLAIIFNPYSFCQNISCDKLVSLFLENKEESKNLLVENKWILYDSVNYLRLLPGKQDEQKLFYRKPLSNSKIADSIVFITHYNYNYNFMDTAVGVRNTLVQYKTTSQKQYGQVKNMLEQSGKLLFDTTGERGTYRFYEYKKAVVKVFESTEKEKSPVYLFWVMSKYAFNVSRPHPRLESNIKAPPVEAKGTGVPLFQDSIHNRHHP